MKQMLYTGINIQYPISRLISSRTKVVETRTYPLPKNLVGQDLVIIETPGKGGDFKARMIGLVAFGESFKYHSKAEFYADIERHCVEPDSPWAWQEGKGKWGWPILKVTLFKKPTPLQKRAGIVYSKGIRL